MRSVKPLRTRHESPQDLPGADEASPASAPSISPTLPRSLCSPVLLAKAFEDPGNMDMSIPLA